MSDPYVAKGCEHRAGGSDWCWQCVRAVIVRSNMDLVEMQTRSGALSTDWDPEQWRVEAEIIAERIIFGEEP
jgi:uncharacterized lipoprotein